MMKEMQLEKRVNIYKKFMRIFITNGSYPNSWDEIFIRGEGCNTSGC
jgi:hypothetical protein